MQPAAHLKTNLSIAIPSHLVRDLKTNFSIAIPLHLVRDRHLSYFTHSKVQAHDQEMPSLVRDKSAMNKKCDCSRVTSPPDREKYRPFRSYATKSANLAQRQLLADESRPRPGCLRSGAR